MGSNTARFRRHARLTRQREFERVFRGNVASSKDGCFTVLARPNGLGYPRLGLAVSRKAAARAVDRNRIKRLVRESFRHSQDHLGGLDVVVLAKRSIAEHDNRSLREHLERHWSRLSHRCGAS